MHDKYIHLPSIFLSTAQYKILPIYFLTFLFAEIKIIIV